MTDILAATTYTMSICDSYHGPRKKPEGDLSRNELRIKLGLVRANGPSKNVILSI